MSRNPPESSANRNEQDNAANQWHDVYSACESGLRAFLRGRLGQEADIDDCLQVVCIQMIQKGSNVAPAARRAWLFRVAANESARMWRRKSTTDRVMEKQASNLDETTQDDATGTVILNETNEKLTQAIGRFPETTQQIIRMRIHDDLTFQQIADQLNIPIGTALTRMRRALEKLRNEIEPDIES